MDIILNGKTGFSITRKLWLALRRIRPETNIRLLWIDAICIDQDNVEERTGQIKLMSHIFRHASRVIVWLGKCFDVEFRIGVAEKPSEPQRPRAWNLFYSWIDGLIDRRAPFALFATRNGFVGIARDNVRSDDTIALLHGCRYPAVLRPQPAAVFKFEGFVYVNGIMHNELQDETPDVEFYPMVFVLI